MNIFLGKLCLYMTSWMKLSTEIYCLYNNINGIQIEYCNIIQCDRHFKCVLQMNINSNNFNFQLHFHGELEKSHYVSNKTSLLKISFRFNNVPTDISQKLSESQTVLENYMYFYHLGRENNEYQVGHFNGSSVILAVFIIEYVISIKGFKHKIATVVINTDEESFS